MTADQGQAAAEQTIATVMLGSFGTVRETQADTAAPIVETAFQWYGQRVRVDTDASELDLFEFMGQVGDLDEADHRAIGPVYRLLKRWVHPDDWSMFWTTCRAHSVDMSDDLLPLVKALSEAVTNRPTVRPSDSSAGPSTTAPPSTGVSLSPAVERSLVALGDRPDLAGFILQAHPEAFPEPGTD